MNSGKVSTRPLLPRYSHERAGGTLCLGPCGNTRNNRARCGVVSALCYVVTQSCDVVSSALCDVDAVTSLSAFSIM